MSKNTEKQTKRRTPKHRAACTVTQSKNTEKQKPKRPRAERLLRFFAYFFGIAIFLMFTAYLVRQAFFPEGSNAVALAVTVALCALLPLIVFPVLYRKKPRLAVTLLALYLVFALFFWVTFVVHLWDTLFFPTPDSAVEELPDDAIVLVFGSKIQGDQPARPLARRLDRALELLDAHPTALCVVAGGQGADEQYPEAVVMKNYLVAHGVDGSRILIEDQSRNTVENIANIKTVLALAGLEDRLLACVSSGYHVPRIRVLMERAGLDGAYFYSADLPNPASLFFALIREYCSRAKLLLGL